MLPEHETREFIRAFWVDIGKVWDIHFAGRGWWGYMSWVQTHMPRSIRLDDSGELQKSEVVESEYRYELDALWRELKGEPPAIGRELSPDEAVDGQFMGFETSSFRTKKPGDQKKGNELRFGIAEYFANVGQGLIPCADRRRTVTFLCSVAHQQLKPGDLVRFCVSEVTKRRCINGEYSESKQRRASQVCLLPPDDARCAVWKQAAASRAVQCT